MTEPHREYTQQPLPPQLPGLPLLGNTLQLLRKDATRFFIDAYEQCGPVFRVNYLFHSYTVMAGPEALEHLLKAREKGLSRRAFFGPVGDELGGVVLLSESYDSFQHLRGQTRLAFSRQVAAEFIPDVIEAVDQALDRHPVGETISVMDFFTRVSFDQYTRLLCGESLDEHFDAANRYAVWVMNIGVKKWPQWSVRLPAYKRAKTAVMAMAEDLLHRYENRPPDHGMPFTILDALLAARNDDGEPMSRADLIATIQYGIIGTIVYMNRTMSFLLHDLLSHPEAMQRVREEVDGVFVNGLPDSLSLRGMSVMQGALKESMRLHPVSLGMPFMVDEPFQFNGHTVEAGKFCIYTGVPNHFAPKFYPDPQRFDPDRCRAPRNEHKQRRAYAPFGYGKRVCTAGGMVETLTLCTISRLLYRREMVMVPEGDPLRTVLEPLPGPDRKFRVRFTEERSGARTGGPDRWRLAANALEELFGSGRESSPAIRERLDRVIEERFPAGHRVVVEGEEADAFYILVEGSVAVLSADQSKPLAELVAGDFFGEIGLLGAGRRTASCVAARDAVVLKMDREDFLSIVRDVDLVPGEIAASVRHRYLAAQAQKALPSLDADRLKTLAADASVQQFEPGSAVVRQGEDAQTFYIILAGEAEVSVASEHGEAIVATLGPGEFFGEIGILEGRPRNATVSATKQATLEVLAVPRGSLLEMVAENPRAQADIASVIMDRLVLAG